MRPPHTGPAMARPASSETSYGRDFFLHRRRRTRRMTETCGGSSNIHTGGSENGHPSTSCRRSRPLSEFAAFTDDATRPLQTAQRPGVGEGAGRNVDATSDAKRPAIHIDLHIHLPPDKSRSRVPSDVRGYWPVPYGPVATGGARGVLTPRPFAWRWRSRGLGAHGTALWPAGSCGRRRRGSRRFSAGPQRVPGNASRYLNTRRVQGARFSHWSPKADVQDALYLMLRPVASRT